MRKRCCKACINPGYEETFVLNQNPVPFKCCCCPKVIDEPATGDMVIEFDDHVIQSY